MSWEKNITRAGPKKNKLEDILIIIIIIFFARANKLSLPLGNKKRLEWHAFIQL